jgi:hypothetical protein
LWKQNNDLPLQIFNPIFSNGPMVLRAVCLCFLLQVWGDHYGVFGGEEARIDLKNDYLNNDAWDLVEAGNKAITSLSELSDGVFSLQLAAVRSDCETGTEFCSLYLPTN